MTTEKGRISSRKIRQLTTFSLSFETIDRAEMVCPSPVLLVEMSSVAQDSQMKPRERIVMKHPPPLRVVTSHLLIGYSNSLRKHPHPSTHYHSP